jgi:hypothetical protein
MVRDIDGEIYLRSETLPPATAHTPEQLQTAALMALVEEVARLADVLERLPDHGIRAYTQPVEPENW